MFILSSTGHAAHALRNLTDNNDLIQSVIDAGCLRNLLPCLIIQDDPLVIEILRTIENIANGNESQVIFFSFVFRSSNKVNFF